MWTLCQGHVKKRGSLRNGKRNIGASAPEMHGDNGFMYVILNENRIHVPLLFNYLDADGPLFVETKNRICGLSATSDFIQSFTSV